MDFFPVSRYLSPRCKIAFEKDSPVCFVIFNDECFSPAHDMIIQPFVEFTHIIVSSCTGIRPTNNYNCWLEELHIDAEIKAKIFSHS